MVSSPGMPVGGEDDTIANEPTSARLTASAANLLDGTELIAGRYRIVRWHVVRTRDRYAAVVGR